MVHGATQMKNQILSSPDEATLRATTTQIISTMITKEADRATVIEWGMDSDPRMTAESMYHLYTNDLRDDLTHIKAPALILSSWIAAKNWGGTLESVSDRYKQQYTNLENQSFWVHEDARHFIMLDDPEWMLDKMTTFLKAN
jgi:hypothetical protein